MTDMVERLAKVIASQHGATMTYKPPGEMMHTVASQAGFGHWGHSPGEYAEKRWQQYRHAAWAVLEILQPPQWQTMETAPKDTPVLGFVPYGVEIDDHVYTWPEDTLLRRVPMRWHEPNERTSRAAGWYVPWVVVVFGVWDDPSTDFEAIQVEPTHWMPLPEPPKE